MCALVLSKINAQVQEADNIKKLKKREKESVSVTVRSKA